MMNSEKQSADFESFVQKLDDIEVELETQNHHLEAIKRFLVVLILLMLPIVVYAVYALYIWSNFHIY